VEEGVGKSKVKSQKLKVKKLDECGKRDKRRELRDEKGGKEGGRRNDYWEMTIDY